MSCKRVEPVPTEGYEPGDIVYSPGFSHRYMIVSYPVCRLYYDPEGKFKLQPHSFEWAGGKGNPNYLSYLVINPDFIGEPYYITDRCLQGQKHKYQVSAYSSSLAQKGVSNYETVSYRGECLVRSGGSGKCSACSN